MVELYVKEGVGVVSGSKKCIYIASNKKRFIKKGGEYVHIVKKKGEFVIANDKKTSGGNEEAIETLLFEEFFKKNGEITKYEIDLSKDASSSYKKSDYFVKNYKNDSEQIEFVIYIKENKQSLILNEALSIYKKYKKYKYERILKILREQFLYRKQMKDKQSADEKNKLLQNPAISKLYSNEPKPQDNKQASSFW